MAVNGNRLNRQYLLTGHLAITATTGHGFFALDAGSVLLCCIALGNISSAAIVMILSIQASKKAGLTG